MTTLPKYVPRSRQNPDTLTFLKRYSSVLLHSENSLSYRIFAKVLAILLTSLAVAFAVTLFSCEGSQLRLCALYIGIALAICVLLTIVVYCIASKIATACKKPPSISRIEIV
ncbi:hypothetical protein CpB0447 [Chlamydia pneumoniae TW-183]|uniref:Uncharacterized protein n=2 Tax=Chlamydia pneumoniae TaxID=83558 RepID=Q9Z8B2_CHLPN|nr:hypothetical protein [Chlamydia pneumoniae]AAD18575.1 hypothetical protein CPn_0431 [Chlamydia pneumoniae CWL029]AAF38177.1 hypothetical protein CP_0322 [Chlamydia pneumoniae AR39]AAP98378.1 hypothetical protein CpB0447 [Chlamydia pneumoniae TW-183]CRI32933.1 Uncharacterized protein BN1224_Wien1_A_04400 [Chlamydia pneumoniae]CRI35796.1 Uncharacterized protein BN1224_CM1_A_04430 [Chlamydia pneumoniae]